MTKGLIIGIFAMYSITAIAQTEILNEDFESGAPVAFTIVDNDGFTPNAATSQFTEAWTQMPEPGDTAAIPNTVMGSTSYFEPTGTASRWLITPPLVLGAYGNFLFWDARSHDPSFPDSYKVMISTTDTQIASFTETVGNVQEEYATWFNRTIDLSDLGYANQTIYVAFVNTTNDGFALYVDNILAEIENPVGINELSEIAVTVYPNPVSDVLKVKSESKIESIELISLSGAILMSSSENEMNVSTLKNGTYFVRIRTEKGVAVEKFVKR